MKRDYTLLKPHTVNREKLPAGSVVSLLRFADGGGRVTHGEFSLVRHVNLAAAVMSAAPVPAVLTTRAMVSPAE